MAVRTGTDASDILVGTNGSDVIEGLEGNDLIFGRRGANRGKVDAQDKQSDTSSHDAVLSTR